MEQNLATVSTTQGEVNTPKKYGVPSGTSGAGKPYEIRIMALLALRCCSEELQDFWLAANAKQVGTLDDIILYKKNEADHKEIAYFIQLKHQDDPKNIVSHMLLAARGDFSLKKHFERYTKIKSALDDPAPEADIIKHLKEVKERVFIIFTNKGVTTLTELLPEIMTLPKLDSIRVGGSIFQFDHTVISNIDLDFLQNLFLFTNQSHFKDMDNEIINEIQALLHPIKLSDVDLRDVALKMISFVFEWSNGCLNGHYPLTRELVLKKLSELLLLPYMFHLQEPKAKKCEDNGNENIWYDLIKDKDVTIIDDVDEAVLQYVINFTYSVIGKNKTLDSITAVSKELMRVITNPRNLSIGNKYELLWKTREIPLLLELSDEQFVDRVQGILKAFPGVFRVVILNRTNVKLEHAQTLTLFDNIIDLSKKHIYSQTTRRQQGDRVHGNIYQLKLLMLFLYRGVFREYSFRLGTEIEEAKKFDDLVFEYTKGGKKEYRLLQAKHRLDESKKITADNLLTESDGDYSLTKYFFSYQDSKKEKLFKGGSIKDVTICTNIDLDFERLESAQITIERIEGKDDILDVKSHEKQPMRYRFNEDVTSLLKPKLHDYNFTKLARRLAECFLKNSSIKHHDNYDIFKSYHLALAEEVVNIKEKPKKFHDKFIEGINISEDAKKFRKAFIEEIKRQSKGELALENINEAINKRKIIDNRQVSLNLSKRFGEGENNNWPSNAISDDEVKDFLNHLVFAVNQPNEEELGEIIKGEMGKGFDLNFITAENIYNKFFMTMLNWLQGKERDRFLSYEEGKKFFEEARRGIPIWFDMKDPVELFAGREKELIELDKALQRNQSKVRVTVISQITSISGLGGIGKTELARKYADDHKNDYDGNVIWINGENYGTLENSFLNLARDNRLGIPTNDRDGKEKTVEAVVKEIYRFFAEGKCLFIFDNAEKNVDLKKFLPLDLPPDANKPHILITSRDREWEAGIEVIELEELKPEDAIEFVKKRLGINDKSQDKEIKTLVEKLQCFPLAMQQVVAYIEDQRVTGEFSIGDYLEEYEKKSKDLLNSDVFIGIGNHYAKTTYTTWQITIDKIGNTERYGQLALKILNVIAYLSSEKIRRGMLLDLAGGNEKQLISAVRLLVRYSIVNREQKQSVLSIHRLVQQVTRIELEGNDKNEEVVKETFVLLEANFPYGKTTSEDYSRKKQLLPHLEAFLSHIDDLVAKKSEDKKQKLEKDYIINLLIWMSDGYSDFGDPQKQKEWLERALEIQKKHYGPDHFEVVLTLVNLGKAYGALGDPQKEKELLERALSILEKHYGPDHFEVARTLVNLGNAYGALGDPQKEKELLERALRIQKKHCGPDHFEVAITLVNLGNAYGALGDPQKKKELIERALRILEKHYGPDHFEVARTLVNLGNAYGALGDPQKKKELLERALRILEKHYGPDHFEVARTLVNLGNAYGALGDPQKEKELLERALRIQKKHCGPDHFEVAITLVNLGNAYGALGDPQKKKELIERALRILEKHYGPDHFEVARTLVNLGNAYGALGDPQKKKELLERALRILEKHYGPDHFEVARTLVNLGNAYGALGDPQKEKELLERALRIQKKHYGPDHFEVARTLVNLGNAYGALGDPQKKKELIERALRILEKHYGPDHFEVARTLVNLGNAYGALGDPQKKKELLERALRILEKHYGPDHFEVARTLVNLGIAYGALGDPQKQKELLERALRILEKHYGPDHFEVARTLVNLGIAYGALGDPQKQKELLERALRILEKHYGPDHFEVARTLVNLGNAYGALGDPQKQIELLEPALSILEKPYGPDHFDVAITLANLSDAYAALGDPQQQMELLERALKIEEKHYGPDHFEVARTLLNLGNAYWALGDHQKQKELLERALSILEKLYGPDHFEVARTLVNLGSAYGALGDPQKKKELIERALKIEEKHYGPDHFEVARTLVNLGNAYGALGDPQKQKELLERALKIEEKHYGPDHFEVARTLVNLGNAYWALGDHQKQKELLERALSILEKHYGPDHFEVARTLVNLGSAYGALGDPQKKKELIERASKIEEKHYGPDHFEVARTLVNLGNAYGALGDPQKACEAYERASRIGYYR